VPVFQSVVCAVDFSDHTRGAIRWAAALTAPSSGRLAIVTLADPLLAQAARTAYNMDVIHDDIVPELREAVRQALPPAAWLPTPHLIARVGEAADGILSIAKERHADVIVLGTRGLGGLRKLFLGSTTERVLRASPVAVLAVPVMESDPLDFQDSGPTFRLRQVVLSVAAPGSHSPGAGVANTLAHALHAPLTIVHVVQSIDTPTGRSMPPDVHDRQMDAARASLEALARDLAAPADTRVVVTAGPVAETISLIATESGPSLVVVGLGSRSGHRGGRPGTVAYRVLSIAKGPVLAVPSDAPSS
jgi:nucleotide-binding universal stress UspA family protein